MKALYEVQARLSANAEEFLSTGTITPDSALRAHEALERLRVEITRARLAGEPIPEDAGGILAAHDAALDREQITRWTLANTFKTREWQEEHRRRCEEVS